MIVVKSPKNKNKNWRSIIQTEVIFNQIKKKLKIETFGIIEKNIVLHKGTPSYTSAAQAWNGKQASFTKSEKYISQIPNLNIFKSELAISLVWVIIFKDSITKKFNEPISKIQQQPSKKNKVPAAPIKKYFNAASELKAEVLAIPAKINKQKDCNSKAIKTNNKSYELNKKRVAKI